MSTKINTCKHKFEPRYDEEEKTTLDSGNFKSKTYVLDICVKCGTKINRFKKDFEW